MSVQRLGIQEYLQQKVVQQRIQQCIQQTRSNVTVSISRAANLFGFSESQLREWERKGLLSSERGTISQDGRGHRQYTTNELNKLAVLQELFQAGKYAPSDIPLDFDTMWEHIAGGQPSHVSSQHTQSVSTDARTLTRKMPIDQRVEYAEQEVFWRYFTAQALRLSLRLICEDIPDTTAGLILPLQPESEAISNPRALARLEEVLIGWLNLNGSFDTFLETNPFFEHPSDFRIEPLVAIADESVPLDNTLIVVQRKTKPQPLNLSLELVQTVRSLLKQVYKNVEHCRATFNYGMRDYLYQATDFSSTATLSDEVLDKLMDMVIRIGGKSTHNPEQDRWRFCSLLLPQDATLPVQQRSLIIRAQSDGSPYKVGIDTVSIGNPGLSLRAYQSGNIIYRPDLSMKDLMIAYQEQEQSVRSAIALPVIRADGLSIAVLYIASDETQAFPIEDQRILRIMGTMIEELLLTYQARQQVRGKRSDLIEEPEIIDLSFKDYWTENDFIRDLETLLTFFHETDASNIALTEELSFIAVDIDNQSTIAVKYGDRIARNLSREVGKRLHGHLNLSAKLAHRRLYHLNVDRYFLLLEGMSLTDARTNAEQIRETLCGKHLIDAQGMSSERLMLPASMLELPGVTVRLGVTSYTHEKVKEVLERYDAQTAVSEFRTLIMASLDEVLEIGRREGGNNIISWNPHTKGYGVWSPSVPEQASG